MKVSCAWVVSDVLITYDFWYCRDIKFLQSEFFDENIVCQIWTRTVGRRGNRRVTPWYFYLIRVSFMWLSLKGLFESAMSDWQMQRKYSFSVREHAIPSLRSKISSRRCSRHRSGVELFHSQMIGKSVVWISKRFSLRNSSSLSILSMWNLSSTMRAFCNAACWEKIFIIALIV